MSPPELSFFGPLILALYRQRWFCLLAILAIGVGSTGWLWLRWPAPTWQVEATVVFAPKARLVLAARLESRALARQVRLESRTTVARQSGLWEATLRVLLPPPTQPDGVSRIVATAATSDGASQALIRSLDELMQQLAHERAEVDRWRDRQALDLRSRLETELAQLPAVPTDGVIRLPATDRPVFWILNPSVPRSLQAVAQEARITALMQAGAPALPEPLLTVIDPPGPAIRVSSDFVWPMEVAWLVSLAVGVCAALVRDCVQQTFKETETA